MPNVFRPEHNALDQIFANEMRFMIPEYQRPYSWQALGKSDRNSQINRMWDDLWSFFNDMEEDKEYFLGSMVIIERKLRTLEVVDGQQRLTSLLLLFTAMRCFLRRRLEGSGGAELGPEVRKFAERAVTRLEEFVYNEQSFGLAPELKVKIEYSTGYDYDGALKAAAACNDRGAVGHVDDRFDEVVDRYFDNRDYFLARLEQEFLDEQEFSIERAQLFDRFFTFLATRVALVLIKTTDFETAYSIFEILNNRGLPLTNLDLLRNFVIKKFAEAGGQDGADAWFRLESDYVLTEDFTARWVESVNGAKQRQSAFSGIQKIFNEHYAKRMVSGAVDRFHDDLRRALACYSLIAEPVERIDDPFVRSSVRLIGQLGNTAYSSTLLLAAFRFFGYEGGKPGAALEQLLRQYERQALAIWLQPRRRFSIAAVYRSVRHLLDENPDAAVNELAIDKDDLSDLSARIDGPMSNSVAKVLLAAYVWSSEEPDDVVRAQLRLDNASVEHIIPVTPPRGSQWRDDFSKEFRGKFTQRLGNRTLLTGRMNSRAKNYEFARKKEIYRKTSFGLTRELVALEKITPEWIEQRQAAMVKVLRQRWGLPT